MDRDQPAGKADEQTVKVTLEMIKAGAAALLDGSDLMREFSPSAAEYYAERVLNAGFRARLARIFPIGSK
jgi:hypothetical protein